MTQHFGNQAGGVVFEFRSPCGGSISLWLDGAEAPAAQWQLPEAKQWRRQLFALPKPLSGEHACEWRLEGGAELKNWTIHQQEEMVVGRNPLTGMDFPDVDMIRVGDTYYMISTTMYFMPGAVILRSYDLINWEYCTRIYDVLEDTPRQRLDEGNAYSAGMWAATLRFHKGRFYVIFVANDTHKTYLYRADDIMGPWQKSEMEGFYHDCSLLFDDDERVYLVYGGKEIHLLELNAELTGPEPGGLNRIIADSGESEFLGYEGSHLYKINGKYYLFVIHSLRERWWRVETCLMSESLTGEFRGGIVMDDHAGLRNDGVAQGGIVDTPDGRWYAILFQDSGAVGRIPLLMPMTWENDFPVLGEDGKVPLEVCNLSTRPGYVYAPLWHSDSFESGRLEGGWEWNHIPQLDRVTVGEGRLTIRTGRVDEVFTQTQNMLTQRTLQPACAAEVTLDAAALEAGDVAGLCALQSRWGYVGLRRTAEGFEVVYAARGLEEAETGFVRECRPWKESQIRLRVEMHFSAERDYACFFYSEKGQWKQLGTEQPLYYLLDHFTGYRFALFVQSTQKAGGQAVFRDYVMEQLAE